MHRVATLLIGRKRDDKVGLPQVRISATMSPESPRDDARTPAEIAERRFGIPATFLTRKAWIETGVVSAGYSNGIWVSDDDGQLALRKPGFKTPDGLEAFRELIAGQIARWLSVRLPAVELQFHETLGPVSLSMEIDGALVTFLEVFRLPPREGLFDPAKEALGRHGGVVVLDCLVGACDRYNVGNHVFAMDEAHWYSLDYSQSFNQRLERTGLGDPSIRWGGIQDQRHFREFYDAIQLNPEPFRSTLAVAERIPDIAFEGLLGSIPAAFASTDAKTAALEFLKYRRTNLRSFLKEWFSGLGLGEVL